MTNINNGPADVDHVRAARLVLATNPNGIDVLAVNQLFEEIGEEGRSGQTLIALCELLHDRDPFLRTDEGAAAIRRSLAKWELKNTENAADSGEEGQPND